MLGIKMQTSCRARAQQHKAQSAETVYRCAKLDGWMIYSTCICEGRRGEVEEDMN
jgi:hypothetical protein